MEDRCNTFLQMKKLFILFSVLLNMTFPISAFSQIMRGDVNLDNNVGVDDVTALIDYMISKVWPDSTYIDTDSTLVEHSILLQMQGGQLIDGYSEGSITKRSHFIRYSHSVLMLNIQECEIVNVAISADETLSIFCYGGDAAYMCSVTSLDSIPGDACFVKFMTYKQTGYFEPPLLEITVKGACSYSKNDVPERITTKFISFECDNIPTNAELEDSISNNDSITRLYDNGFIKLPPNYTRDGEPVPLVIFVHGTGGYSFTYGPKADGGSGDYSALQDFIVNNGYALCDCSGLTNKYKSVGHAFAAPSFISCIEDMVKYLLANYNIKDDGFYVYCKSAGGFAAHMLALKQTIHVKAVGSLAPALSPMVSMSNHARTCNATANLEAEQIGVNGIISTTFDAEDQALITDNIEKWRQIDPFFCGTDLTDEQVKQIVTMCYTASAQHLNISDLPDAVAMCDSAQRWVPCPTKIWIAEDDMTVYHGNSRLFVEMAQRTGSQCYLRTMPRGTGKHHAVDTDENALKVIYQTKYAGEVEIAAAYAELIDWFNLW